MNDTQNEEDDDDENSPDRITRRPRFSPRRV